MFNIDASCIVCNKPNTNADKIINNLSFFIKNLKHLLNIVSSTIGAHIIAAGIKYNIFKEYSSLKASSLAFVNGEKYQIPNINYLLSSKAERERNDKC